MLHNTGVDKERMVNFTLISDVDFKREVYWTVRFGTYELFLIIQRTQPHKASLDAFADTHSISPGRCADTGKIYNVI